VRPIRSTKPLLASSTQSASRVPILQGGRIAALFRALDHTPQSSRTRLALFAIAIISLLILPAHTSAQTPAHPPTQAGTQKSSPAKSSPLLPWEIAAGSHQQFDVISVHENKSGVPWNGGDPQVANIPYGPDDNYRNSGGIFSATNYPLLNLIVFAYKVWTPQGAALAASLPDWTMTAGFNIEARTDNRNVTKDQMRLMMQALLADRFHLVLHTESRQVPLYAAVLAKPGKLGPSLRPHPANDPCTGLFLPRNQSGPGAGPPPPDTVDGGFPVRCGTFVGLKESQPWIKGEGSRNIPMEMVVSTFTGLGNLGHPVLDQTGLTGDYDFKIEFLPEPPPGAELPPEATGPSFIDALRDQLGIKLVPQKGPFDFLLVDRIEHPSEN